jgi:hypothetical protein
MTSRPYGMTLQVQVGDLARAREFYTALLGSSPEFEPHQDFLEWRVIRGGETWLQGVGDLAPSGQQPVAGASVHDKDQFVTG